MKTKRIDFKSLFQIVNEFFNALSENHTYNIKENWYCLFGLLWSIPIPVLSIGMDLHSSGISFSLINIINRILIHPIHVLFLFHPVIFSIVFGAMGTIRYNKDKEIKEFEKNLIIKNEDLEKINKKLQEIDMLKSNFLTMISHELRTPLTSILGYISFLKTGKAGILTQSQVESLSLSEDEAVRLNHLIEELLDLTKIEMGEFKINLQHLNINEIIIKAMRVLQPLASSRNIILKSNLSNNILLANVDNEKIFQVIVNLIENGIKFNNPGQNVTVFSEEKPEINKIRICVMDTGIGIEEREHNKIFDRFYQVDSLRKRKYGGCGLGLAISKRIVELHQGKIWVESKIGSGSKFYIEIPKVK